MCSSPDDGMEPHASSDARTATPRSELISREAAAIRTKATEKRLFALFVTQGDQHATEGEFGKASNSYSKALEMDPGNVHVLCRRSVTFCHQCMYESALVDAELAIVDGGADGEAHFCKGEALYHLNQLDMSVAAFQHACDTDPSSERFKGGLLKAQMSEARAMKEGRAKEPSLKPPRKKTNLVQRLFNDPRLSDLLTNLDLDNDFLIEDPDNPESVNPNTEADIDVIFNKTTNDEQYDDGEDLYLPSVVATPRVELEPLPPRPGSSASQLRRPNTSAEVSSPRSVHSSMSTNRPRTTTPRSFRSRRYKSKVTPRSASRASRAGGDDGPSREPYRPKKIVPPSDNRKSFVTTGFRQQVKQALHPPIAQLYKTHRAVVPNASELRSSKRGVRCLPDSSMFEYQQGRE